MTGGETTPRTPETFQRADKWLWYARFFKSRSLATRLCNSRKLRINHRIVEKASTAVKVGDVLTFPQGRRIRTVKVLTPGVRRGPAIEACLLYDDLTPTPPAKTEVAAVQPVAARPPGAGRPTKSDRRATDKLAGKD
ncbi:MAG: RNA-binding S4 domain-containing protein [Rhodospirillales bacterium]|nr:RNA-binding S4 domain-containing protein [Rhodospirillales bacterium]